MSFLMMLNKVQSAEDLSLFLKMKSDIVDRLLQGTSEHVLAIIADMVASLCRRLNVSAAEAQECVEKVRKREMGYLFENMDKMDIQAERRNTEEARKMAEEALKAKEAAERAGDEEQKAREAAEKAREEEQKAREEAQQKVALLEAELLKYKK